MNSPRLIFTPRGLGSEIARVGDDLVGEIIPCGVTLSWIFRAGSAGAKQGPARSYEFARQRIEIEAREWLMRLGWLLPGDRLEVIVPDREVAR